MKIQGIVTETTVVDMEINLPYYVKHEDYFFMVTEQEKLVRVHNYEGWEGVSALPVSNYTKEINKGSPVTEEQFFEVFNKVKNVIQEIAIP